MSANPATDTGGLLTFSSDVGTRRQWFVERSFSHPAKLHLGLLQWILDRYTVPGDTVLDPMAGSGSVLLAATQQRHVIARDVEPSFLALLHENAAHILRICGLFAGRIDIASSDAREPWGISADHIIMSPPYGCEAARGAKAHKGMLSYSERARGGAMPLHRRWAQLDEGQAGAAAALRFHYGEHPAQVGHLRGPRYWQAMSAVYTHAAAALSHRGYLVLIIKDHIYRGRRVCVADDTVTVCEGLGLRLVERHRRLVHPLSLWQRRRKERGEPIVETEDVLTFARVALAETREPQTLFDAREVAR